MERGWRGNRGVPLDNLTAGQRAKSGPFLARQQQIGSPMTANGLLAQVASRKTSKEAIADRIVRKPALLPVIIKGLGADEASVKYGCLKVLRLLSEKKPALLYPRIGHFFGLLDSDNTFLKWGAVVIVGNLAAVDARRKIDAILRRYLQPIGGPVMITAANVVGGAAKIAVAKPELADKIARALLKVERAKYQTSECRNVALGHAIKAFDQFFDQVKEKQAVLEFVRRQLSNRRRSVRRKAAEFLKRHGQGSEAGRSRAK
jgi:hypothetical protein